MPGSSSMGFSRQEYWSGLPCPSPGDLLNPETESRSPALQADSLKSELPGKSSYSMQAQFSPWAKLSLLLNGPCTKNRLYISQMFLDLLYIRWAFPGGSDSKESACNAGDLDSIPGLGRPPGEGNGNPLQYSCLENSMDRGSWWVAIHVVTKSQT